MQQNAVFWKQIIANLRKNNKLGFDQDIYEGKFYNYGEV
jgi:hypothetical protein